MEDVTEPPFRLICKRLGADITYTEFISSDGLIRDARKARNKLFYYDEERPVGIQIIGRNIEVMNEAARIAETAHPDFIDINCGCWVKDVALKGSGAGFLKDIPAMKNLAENILRSVNLPVTIKTRLGWDKDSIVIVEVAKIMEDIGIQALTVHCRIRGQGNKGEADWSWIKKIKDSGVKIPIILNGNIKSPEDVKFVFDNFQPDAVMIGQAAINNPWIFKQAKYFLENGTNEKAPSLKERINTCLEHLKLAVEFKGEKYGVLEFRKHYSGYLREYSNISEIRLELMKYTDYKPIEERLIRFREEVCDSVSNEDFGDKI
jgi:tRNA-dihydrouridine synthase B